MRYTPETVAQVIKSTRKELGLSQEQVAMTAGTGLRFIYDLETGKPTCEIGKVLAVLNTLGITVTLTAPNNAQGAAKP